MGAPPGVRAVRRWRLLRSAARTHARSLVTSGETIQNDNGTVNAHLKYIEYGHGSPPYVEAPDANITAPKEGAI